MVLEVELAESNEEKFAPQRVVRLLELEFGKESGHIGSIDGQCRGLGRINVHGGKGRKQRMVVF